MAAYMISNLTSMSYRASHVAQPPEEGVQNLLAVDRISALPNDILAIIVSLLNLKEAVATSVLSTRWRHIWTFVPTLDFHHDVLFRLRYFRRVEIASELDRYLNGVDGVVKQHRGSTVNLLRVYADVSNESSIRRWVQFAMEKSVQNFDLLLAKNKCIPIRGANEIKAVFVTFPKSDQLFNVDEADSLNQLCSKSHPLRSCFSAFSCSKYIGALDFRYVTGLTGQDLEFFLSHCPVLGRLTVVGTLRKPSFKVIGPLIALKYLHLDIHNKVRVSICDVNLVSFSYSGQEITLVLRNVPQLVEVSISLSRHSVGLCDSQLPQLEVLRLSGFVLYNDKHEFPTYANLKHLELGMKEFDSNCVLQLASFMRASPCLHKLVLKLASTISVYYFREELEIKQAPQYSHHFLRVVEVEEYHGRTSDFELVRYLVENAVGLEKLVIHPVRQWFSYERRYQYGGLNIARMKDKEERKQATQQLKELVLPSTFQFLCRL